MHLIGQRYLGLVFALFVAIAFSSCDTRSDQSGSADTDIVADLRKVEQEVLDIHDEVMPKMGELNNNRKKLLKHLTTQDSVEYGTHIRESVKHLQEADSLMWAWMHNYSRPDYESDLDSVAAYLESELETVKVMREKFFASLTESDALLEKLNKDE